MNPDAFHTPFTCGEHTGNPPLVCSVQCSASAPVTPGSDAIDPLGILSTQERAVLFALAQSAGKVVSRRELARRVGIADLSERRCDSLLVGVRRVLGADAIRTVRQPGLDARRTRRSLLTMAPMMAGVFDQAS